MSPCLPVSPSFPEPEPLPILGLERFPSHECCEDSYQQGYFFERHVEECIKNDLYSYHNYDEALSYARRSRHAWLACLILQNPRACLEDRLDSLEQLRALLGEEDFWLGRMPYPVPLWACEEVP